jgi:hypothetical protein
MPLAMKLLLRSCLVLAALCAVTVSEAAAKSLPSKIMPTNTINAVLGDVSFVKKFGTAPTPASSEALRIQTHLEYVEMLLRAEDVSHLSPTLRERRAALLDKLHEYRLTSAFPTNLDFPQERRPCFIDAAGNICAVGFLIEQTAGRALAERINAAHHYDFLADMHVPELTAWVEASGLTARECAMIQPQYDGFIQDPNFKAFAKNPIAMSALKSGCILDVELRGIDISIPVTTSTLNLVFNKLLLTPRETIWFKYGTFWGGLASFGIPAMPNITAGTYQIGLIFFLLPYPGYTGLPYRYITTTNITISLATSIRDLTLSSAILISPNPVTDALTLALPENELHSVRLTNTLGCAVWTLSEASGTTTLDVSGLSAGVYFVEVQSARRRSVQKVVKY